MNEQELSEKIVATVEERLGEVSDGRKRRALKEKIEKELIDFVESNEKINKRNVRGGLKIINPKGNKTKSDGYFVMDKAKSSKGDKNI